MAGSSSLLRLGDVHAAACGLQSGKPPGAPRRECCLVPFKQANGNIIFHMDSERNRRENG